MDKKKKDQKLSSACDQQSQTIGPQQSKQDTAQPNGRFYTPQKATEQLLAVSSLGLLNQCHQGQIFAQSTPPPPPPPFWQPQWPGPFLGANVPPNPIYQTFTPPGTTDPGCQGVVPGGTSSATQNSVPNMCFQFGYAFPGFPGPCDPSSWYQLQHPYVYNLPGALGFSSATPTLRGCSASGEQSLQRGIIRPTAKLSQEHHQLWEAQSAENVQMWSVINKLQDEVSDYKGRITKLEQEVSSLKQKAKAPPTEQKMKTPSTEVLGTIPLGTGQPRKRGRPPKRSLASAYASQEPPPGARGKKPAPITPLFDIKSPIFEKVILKKADNKEIANHPSTTMAQQQTNGKILNAVKDASGDIQMKQSNSFWSAHQGQVHQQFLGLQTCGSGAALTSGTTIYVGTFDDFQNVWSKLPRPHEVTIRGRSVTVKYTGNTTGDGNHGSTSCMPPLQSARELLDAAHKGLFHGGTIVQQEQGAKATPGSDFANEKDASGELQDTNLGSTQDEEDEEEMGDDTSSTGEALGVPKDVGESAMNNNDMATSPKDLSPLHNW